MSISKFEYSQEIGKCGEELIKAANAYAEYPQTANLKTPADIERFKDGWMRYVDNFRIIQSKINNLEIPSGHEEKGQELRESYKKYVNYIEEKTMKFGIQAINSGEIDLIQKLEVEESQNIVRITEELTKEMFG